MTEQTSTTEDYNEPRGIVLVLLCLVLFVGSAFAGTFTIGGGTAPEALVSYINDGAATTNYGNADSARVEAYLDPIECLKVMRFLVWWPQLSDSLYGRTVTAATLYLTPKYIYIPTDPEGASQLRLHPIRSGRAWNETQVTQNIYKTGSNWGTAGAWNTTSDYLTSPSYTGTLAVFSVNTAHGCDITTIMQTCDGTDTINNKGVIATTVQSNGLCAIMTIWSDDKATTSYRPYITVTYDPPAGVSTMFSRRVAASSDDIVVDSTTAYLTDAEMWYGYDGVARAWDGMRFLNIQVDSNVAGHVIRIDSAWIEQKASASRSNNTANHTFYGELSTAPATYSTNANFFARTKTSASVVWSAIPAWTDNTVYRTPDIKTIIQEIIDQSGYAAGHAISILAHDKNNSTSGAYRTADSYDGSPTTAPLLVIWYTLNPTVAGVSDSRRRKENSYIQKVKTYAFVH